MAINSRPIDKTLTQAALQEKLNYDATSGAFTRKTAQGLARVGKVVGRKHHENGHWYIMVCGNRYPAQLLAWLYVYGAWPDRELTFKDGVRYNVAIGNLELCTE
jgi:hypothetical protein